MSVVEAIRIVKSSPRSRFILVAKRLTRRGKEKAKEGRWCSTEPQARIPARDNAPE